MSVENPEEVVIEETTPGTPPLNESGESVIKKRGPGRPEGWRKKVVEPTTPITEPESIIANVQDLDRELTERLSFAPPNLADNNINIAKPSSAQRTEARFKVPENIEEPYAGTIIQRAHTAQVVTPVTPVQPGEVAQPNTVPEQQFTQQPAAATQPVTGGGPATPAAKTPVPTKPKSEKFESMSGAERRDAVRKDADMYLKGFQQLGPRPFKWLATFNKGKLEAMHMRGELNLNLYLAPPSPQYPIGFTINNYVDRHNAKADQVFIITDAHIETLRPHLEDVLMEKQSVRTPMERLIGAAIPIVLEMAAASAQMFAETRAGIKEMQRLSANMEAQIRNGAHIQQPVYQQPVQQQQQPVQQPVAQPQETQPVQPQTTPVETAPVAEPAKETEPAAGTEDNKAPDKPGAPVRVDNNQLLDDYLADKEKEKNAEKK